MFFGGRLRLELELSSIQVNTVYAGHKKEYKYNVMSWQCS
jgi:hypothetical protein